MAGSKTRTESTQTPQADAAEESEKETEPKTVPQEDQVKKYRSFRIRTISTVALIGGFVGFVWAGHVPLMLLLFLLQLACIREFFEIARVAQQDRKLPGFRAQQYYFFFVALFYLYGRFIKNNLLIEISSTRLLAKLFSWVLRRHTLVSLSLYMGGFVAFVLSLKKGMYLYQFSQFAWTHTIVLVVIVPSSFLVANLFEGIIWWMLPAMLVVSNDIFAYIAGFFWGRTPLIRLSPKKTWEGFIGGAIAAVVAAYCLALALAGHKWLVCPRRDLSLGSLDCEVSDVYKFRRYTWADLDEWTPDVVIEALPLALSTLPPALAERIKALSITAMPIQLHAMVLSVFASVIAPFGGFCASGFKRAFKMKDFGDTIPGHGGVTDRFDCQVMMAIFSYTYYWTYISAAEPNLGDVLDSVLKLSDAQQVALFGKLGNLLVGEGLLPDSVMDVLAPVLASQGGSS
uniref:Phosphatidate cytidylyltransferase n=1 Tax=Chlamydomonas leiostraca TaxID=1034604 RepID=A0A7S0R2F3_9CHLO|mmetsp:Transcript_12257/g.29890  ORF Transcript_12257/g.29890 Transcript_12257/m.29890 type:complete len:457 (+) Transcript_12257:54-1424(+)